MSIDRSRRRLVQAGIALTGAPSIIRAQSKTPMKIIVPLPAGGVADISVRIIAEQWTTLTGQPVVVENRPGGSYLIGMQAIAAAPADGNTLIHLNNGMSATQVTFGRYDMLKQLSIVGKFGGTPGAFFVKADSPHKTIDDILNDLKTRQGKGNYGGIAGGIEHLLAATLLKARGIKATFVAFKGGPDTVTALAPGEIDFVCSALPLIIPFKGRIKALAVMTDKRFPLMPDIPSFRDVVKDGPGLDYWGGFGVPAGTPPAVIETLNKTMAEVLKAPEVARKYAAQGLVIEVESGAALRKMIADDVAWMTPISKELGLKEG